MSRRTGIRWPDAALALVVAAVVVAGTLHIDASAGERAVDPLAFVCGLVGAGALAGWRRWPVPMVVVVSSEIFVYLARGYPGGPALLPGPVALALVGYRTARPVGFAAAAGTSVTVFVGRWIGHGSIDVLAVLGTGWSFAAVFAGQLLATRGERQAAARERSDLEQRQVVAAERLRIAQDLHDTVAHAMATINVQSGVAVHLLERRPEQAKEALEAIRIASRDVLAELAAILGLLRHGDEDRPDDPSAAVAPRAPLAGLDRLADLVSRSRADGLAVDCSVTGDVATVGPAVGAAAYRVVQEALSNTRRHGGTGATAAVALVVGSDRLMVEVVDDGAGPDRAGAAGFGLVGMRERVEATGGSFEAGRRDGPGFRVAASWERPR